MNGKSKCKILKEIRRQIAQDNDIEYVTSECKYQGECSGTCPKCEAELRYLEQELEKRQRAGKSIAVAGIAAALVIGATGCGIENNSQSSVDGDLNPPPSTTQAPSTDTEQTDPTSFMGEPLLPMGDIVIETEPTYDELAGVPLPDDDFYATPGAIPEP